MAAIVMLVLISYLVICGVIAIGIFILPSKG